MTSEARNHSPNMKSMMAALMRGASSPSRTGAAGSDRPVRTTRITMKLMNARQGPMNEKNMLASPAATEHTLPVGSALVYP